MENRKVEELWIYPVKSLPGIRVTEISAEARGLTWDRRFMLVDDQGQFITVRERTELYLFGLTLKDNTLVISHPDASDTLILDSSDYTDEQVKVNIWEDQVNAYAVSSEADQWFSAILEEPVRLVTFGEHSQRLIKEKWRRSNEEVSFADGYPYLVVSRASLEDIERRAGSRMDPRRFRANIIVSGEEAYEEFLWSELSIDKVNFQCLKPCERCVVTTVDPDTLEKSKEPLRSLAGLIEPNRALFGQHAVMTSAGVIHEGDEVIIHSRKAAPYDPL